MPEDQEHLNNNSSHTDSEADKENTDTTKLTAEDFQIIISYNFTDFNPIELLEQFYVLHNDQTLTKEEKNEKLKEIIKRYTR